MKLYFSCSVTGGRTQAEVYQELVAEMLTLGHEVPTAHLSDSDIVEQESLSDPAEIYARDMHWLHDSDVIVAEVTTPSHGVGYEIAMAVNQAKPVLCLYEEGCRVSKILTGNSSPNFEIHAYSSVQEARQLLREFLARKR